MLAHKKSPPAETIKPTDGLKWCWKYYGSQCGRLRTFWTCPQYAQNQRNSNCLGVDLSVEQAEKWNKKSPPLSDQTGVAFLNKSREVNLLMFPKTTPKSTRLAAGWWDPNRTVGLVTGENGNYFSCTSESCYSLRKTRDIGHSYPKIGGESISLFLLIHYRVTNYWDWDIESLRRQVDW